MVKLAEEYETYQGEKEALLLKHQGQFVLIKGRQVVDVFSSYEDALKEGLKEFGNIPFLVKRIQAEEEVNFFYSPLVA